MLEAIGYDGNAIRVGDRVELHPATDLWMRGARFGTVLTLHPNEVVGVDLDYFRRPSMVHARNVRKV